MAGAALGVGGGSVVASGDDGALGFGRSALGAADGRAVGVGFGVGFGVGLTVGFAVGRGVAAGDVDVGALITTRVGDTLSRVADRSPAPEPLTAVNRYAQRPTGRRLANRNVTPVENVLRVAVIR
jgi:hypothetical protein